MFKMSLAEITSMIKEKSGLPESEINQKIDEKLKMLSGLISKEGAAHIIANELGIKLVDSLGGKLQIKNILVGMRSVDTVGKVQQLFNVSSFQRKDGSSSQVGSALIADETGMIRVVLWGDQAKVINQLQEGTVVKVIGGYVRENRGFKEIHMNDRSKMVINPEGETVNVVKETKTMQRKNIKDLNENDIEAEVLGTIVQVFDLRFFEVCPECKTRVRQRDGKFVCGEHSTVTPDYSYVLNLIVDDGTETMRSVFFRNNVSDLLKVKHEDIVALRENIQGFDQLKNELLGEQVKLIGRVNKNEMFNRLEFVVKKVAIPDPNDELARLDAVKAEDVI